MGFYEFFITEGFFKFYYQFFGLKHGNSILFSGDERNESSEVSVKTITKEENGVGDGVEIMFVTELNELLEEQKVIFDNLIKEQILNHIAKEQVQHYFTTLALRIEELIKLSQNSDSLSKHPIIILHLKSLFNEVYEQSSSIQSIPENLKIFYEDLNRNPSESPNTLKMKAQYLDRIPILFEALLNNRLIDSRTSEEDFKQVFSGRYFSSPPKIIWTGEGKNKQFSKASILYFIRALENNHIIEVPKSERDLKEIVTTVFLDNEGIPLRKFAISFSTFKKTFSESSLTNMEQIVSAIMR